MEIDDKIINIQQDGANCEGSPECGLQYFRYKLLAVIEAIDFPLLGSNIPGSALIKKSMVREIIFLL